MRVNVFENGRWPAGGVVVVIDTATGNLRDLYSLIEEATRKKCTTLYTNKGGQITHLNQLVHDDVLVFTSIPSEVFKPLGSNPQATTEPIEQYIVNVKWLCSETQKLENIVLTLFENATVKQLKRKVSQSIDNEFNMRDELCIIYKGVEVEEDSVLYSLFQRHLKESQDDNASETFTVYAVKKPFIITIVTPTSRKISLTLETQEASDVPIKQLKQLVYEHEHQLPDKMKLLFKDRDLPDTETVGSSGLFSLQADERVLKLKYVVF
jgi:hypothetical protein